jgi:hypothetical protein
MSNTIIRFIYLGSLKYGLGVFDAPGTYGHDVKKAKRQESLMAKNIPRYYSPSYYLSATWYFVDKYRVNK